MGRLVVEPEPVGERAEPAVGHLVAHEPAGERDRVDDGWAIRRPPVALEGGAEEGEVEDDVVADDHRVADELEQRCRARPRCAAPWQTRASVSPVSTVICGGIARPGLTSVWNVPRHSPPRTLTAPISVIMSSLRLPPVVSRSSTQNVASASGVPRRRADRRSCAVPTSRRAMGRDGSTNVRSRQEHLFDSTRLPRAVRSSMNERAVRGGTVAHAIAGAPRHLRSALEFAVAMAREGQKLKPPLKYPAELKPYLKRRPDPAAALPAVRPRARGRRRRSGAGIAAGASARARRSDRPCCGSTRAEGWEAEVERARRRGRGRGRGVERGGRPAARREAAAHAAEQAAHAHGSRRSSLQERRRPSAMS